MIFMVLQRSQENQEHAFKLLADIIFERNQKGQQPYNMASVVDSSDGKMQHMRNVNKNAQMMSCPERLPRKETNDLDDFCREPRPNFIKTVEAAAAQVFTSLDKPKLEDAN